MSRILSICIPTLNRCELLCRALRSIFESSIDWEEVEVCVSNNCSDQDYAPLEALLAAAPVGLTLRHIVQPARLPIDEHMLAVKHLAQSPYIYFLGDDDFFIAGQLPRLLALIKDGTPDLAIFNGQLVNSEDAVIGQHFKLPARQYDDVPGAFRDLRDKGMFGAVLVKACHLDDRDFRALSGTAHGYGCYWFSLLKEHLANRPVKIMVPDFPLVALRMAAKNYSPLEVYFRDIPYEIAVYQRHLPTGLPQALNHQFAQDYFRKVASFVFLAQMRLSGMEIRRVKDINPGFYQAHRLRIEGIDALVRTGAYQVLKRIFKVLVKPWRATA